MNQSEPNWTEPQTRLASQNRAFSDIKNTTFCRFILYVRCSAIIEQSTCCIFKSELKCGNLKIFSYVHTVYFEYLDWNIIAHTTACKRIQRYKLNCCNIVYRYRQHGDCTYCRQNDVTVTRCIALLSVWLRVYGEWTLASQLWNNLSQRCLGQCLNKWVCSVATVRQWLAKQQLLPLTLTISQPPDITVIEHWSA